MQDMRRTGNVEAAVGGAHPQDLSAITGNGMAGNTIAVSNAICETCTPVQPEAVRRADRHGKEEGQKKGPKSPKPERKIMKSHNSLASKVTIHNHKPRP